jgi:hypothetical protein
MKEQRKYNLVLMAATVFEAVPVVQVEFLGLVRLLVLQVGVQVYCFLGRHPFLYGL